jgi:hypothetical protein
MVDPFAIEFIKRNKLLTDSENGYWFIKQQVVLPATFSIDYDKSIYRIFETRNKDGILTCQYQSQAEFIDDAVSIFATRYEPYFALNYKTYYFDTNTPFTPMDIIPIISEDLVLRISTGELYTIEDTNQLYLNIIIKWFNHANITEKDLETVSCIDMKTTQEIYYHILFVIFVLDSYVKQLLS